MHKRVVGVIVPLGFVVLVAGGCAKKAVTPGEEHVLATRPSASEAEGTTHVYQGTVPAIRDDSSIEVTNTFTSENTILSEPLAAGVNTGVGHLAWLQEGLQAVYFNFDSAVLSDEARGILVKNAYLLAKVPKVKVRVGGHTDEQGADDYNMALGERRAKAARDYLVNLGFQADRITTVSYGEENPAAAGSSDDAWGKNRRAEFVIVE